MRLKTTFAKSSPYRSCPDGLSPVSEENLSAGSASAKLARVGEYKGIHPFGGKQDGTNKKAGKDMGCGQEEGLLTMVRAAGRHPTFSVGSI